MVKRDARVFAERVCREDLCPCSGLKWECCCIRKFVPSKVAVRCINCGARLHGVLPEALRKAS